MLAYEFVGFFFGCYRGNVSLLYFVFMVCLATNLEKFYLLCLHIYVALFKPEAFVVERDFKKLRIGLMDLRIIVSDRLTFLIRLKHLFT